MARNRTFILCTLAVLLVVISASAVNAVSGEPNIRVGLDKGKSVASFRIYSGTYEVIEGPTGLPIAYLREGEVCTVVKEGPTLNVSCLSDNLTSPYSGPVIVRPVDSGKDNIFSYNNIKYRGSLVVYNGDQGLIVVNSLPVEDYLYGVVGKEMGYDAPLEALKAQAVVSRSYALSNRGSGLYYDVGVDTATQVYGG